VRLVDHEQADLHLAHAFEEARSGEALRSDVEQAQLAGGSASERAGVGGAVLLRVDQRDAVAEPARGERLDLVLHQSHQGRDDDRQVVAQQPGELVAERLPGAGRHHDEHVPVRQRGLAGLALPGAEFAEAEQVAEG
jgi:hypothetical protein